jgi:WD40 repeat protein
VRVWEAMVGEEDVPELPMKKLLAHKTPVLAVAFSPNGHGLASCAQSGNVRLWNWAAEVCQFNLSTAHKTGVNHITFSSDGLRIATSACSGNLKVRPTLPYF